MRVALCQPDVTDNIGYNIDNARGFLLRAHDEGADVAILPEMFTIEFNLRKLPAAAQPEDDSPAIDMLRDTAAATGMTIIGGSLPELHGEKIYNTCYTFDGEGTLLGKYRKAHLFDVDIPGMRVTESAAVSPGNGYPLIIDKPMRIGIQICYDIRFPEWSTLIMKENVDLMAVPAVFSSSTGPRHFELLLRCRAVDNLCFVAAAAPAKSRYSYGHSMLISPDGVVLADLGEDEGMCTVELPMEEIALLRSSIPVHKARREDLYDIVKKLPAE